MPSREEVAHHWPGSVEHALDQLEAAGVRRTIVKLGSAGSVGRTDGDTVRMPAIAVAVEDPTGAGDAFCGAVCARLAHGDGMRPAMAWGAAAAVIGTMVESVAADVGVVVAIFAIEAPQPQQISRRLSHLPFIYSIPDSVLQPSNL